MDEIKLFAESPAKLSSLLTAKIFSEDIKVSFGLEKCASLHIITDKSGDPLQQKHLVNMNILPILDNNSIYNYLGISQKNQTAYSSSLKCSN